MWIYFFMVIIALGYSTYFCGILICLLCSLGNAKMKVIYRIALGALAIFLLYLGIRSIAAAAQIAAYL